MNPDGTVLVTGGCGFIGSNYIRSVIERGDFTGRIVNVDSLTYAANPANVEDAVAALPAGRYIFERADVTDLPAMTGLIRRHEVRTIVHFAAESHVDRSICGPQEFIQTNIVGTFALLEAARSVLSETPDMHFHHVSTDEVYGSLGETGAFVETTPYAPRSPYSASKAASDHLVMAYHHTFGLPVTLSNCSNNYGPYQFPEKLIPLMICNILDGKPLPVYGDGLNVRDWLFVKDHCEAIWEILTRGRPGETYNIGGRTEMTNIGLVRLLCRTVAKCLGKPEDQFDRLIAFVKDRPGHDRRYAIDCGKIERELGWKPSVDFAAGLEMTVRWYLEHRDWIANVKNGSYRAWIDRNYGSRE